MKAGDFSGRPVPRGDIDVEAGRHAVAIAEADPAGHPGVPEQLRALAKAKQVAECNALAVEVIGRRYIT